MAVFKIPVGLFWKILIECLNALIEDELEVASGVTDTKCG